MTAQRQACGSGEVWAAGAQQRRLLTPRERGVYGTEGWVGALTGPEGARHLILEEALDGGAEGTAHEALGSGWVVEEADFQGDAPIL